MAIALVQKTAQQFYDGVTTASRTITGVTAGNLVTATVAVVSQPNTTPVPALPTPSGWTAAIAPTGATGIEAYRGICAIFYKQNAASGSHTIDFTGASAWPLDSYGEITLEEWSGAETSGVLDVVASSALATPNTSGTSGTTATTAVAASVAIAVGNPGGASPTALSSPAATGYTSIDTEPSNATHTAYQASYKILSATATQSASWTWTGNNAWIGIIAVFKGASAPPPSNPILAATELPPIGHDFEYELAGFQHSPMRLDNETAVGAEEVTALPPAGRDFDYELAGYQQDSVVADNSEAAGLIHDDLTPAGRDFDFQLEGYQQPPISDDYSDPDRAINSAHFDLTQEGRNFDYELVGYQQGTVSEVEVIDPTQLGTIHDALPPLGRDFDYELAGFQHVPIAAPAAPGGGPIALVQKTPQLFQNNTTTATRELTGITIGNLLTATVAVISISNTTPVPPLPIPLGWNAAITPVGSTGTEPFRGVVGIYWRIATATIHSINFDGAESLPGSSYAQITIEEWSGAATSNPLDVVATSSLQLPQTSGTSGTTAATSQDDGMALAIGLPGGGAPDNLSTPAATDYTSIDTNPNMSVSVCYETSYKILDAAGTQTASWSWTGDACWTAAIAVFNAGEAPPVPPDQMLPASVDLPPEGRDFEYELEGFQGPPVGPDPVGDDATTNDYFFDIPAEGENFDYELAGYQQGVVGANASQDNVIPCWFEVPQQVTDYGLHLAPFIFVGVGADGIPLFSEVTKWADNPPVLDIVRAYDFQSLPLAANAPPALLSNPSNQYANPPSIQQIFNDIDQGFMRGPVVPDSAVILLSEPSQETDIPTVLWEFSSAYETFSRAPIPPDAFLTESVRTRQDVLPPAGRDFDFDLAGFQRAPPLEDNTASIARAFFDPVPLGRDFDYELTGFQSTPMVDDNEAATADAYYELPPIDRYHDYMMESLQLGIVVDDAGNDPLGLSSAFFDFNPIDRDFNYELSGFQFPIVSADVFDSTLAPSSVYVELPPIGRDFDFDLTGFQSAPLGADHFEVFILMGMVFPAYLEPKIDERDITPYLGQQTSAVRPEILPFDAGGQSFYIPTYRPRRR